MISKSVIVVIIFVAVQSLFSCNDFDQVEKKYENYKLAVEDSLFERGWIAEGLIFNSMETIYLKSNVDLNTYFFTYKLSKADFKKLKMKLQSADSTKEFPHRIDVSTKFRKDMKSLPQLFYVDKDTIYLKVDDRTNLVFGWSG